MRWLPLLLLTLLVGCAGDPVDPPAELESFKPKALARLSWSADAGSPVNHKFIRLNPYIDGDRVVTATINGSVSAFDRVKGNRLWLNELNLDLSAGVGGGEGALFVATRGGEVLALDPQDGHELWSAQVSSEVLSAPVPTLGRVLVRAVDGSIIALAAESGDQLWRYSQGVPPLSLRGTSKPVPVTGGVIVGLDNGKLLALGLEQGRPAWESTITQPEGSSELDRLVDLDAELVVQGPLVFVGGYQGKLALVTMEKGELLWSKPFSTSTGLLLDGEQLFSSDDQGQVWALDARSGNALWKQDKLKFRKLTAPVRQGDYLVVGDFEGYLHWLSRADGRLVARYRPDDYGIIAQPVVSGNTLYVQTRGSTLYAINLTESSSPE